MFSRWGRYVYRFRRPVVVLAILVAIGGVIGAAGTADKLSSGGWFDPDAEAGEVAARLDREFGAGRGSLIALFRSTGTSDATDPAFQAGITATLADLLADDRVEGVVGYAETGDRRFISTDGSAAYVIVQLAIDDDASVEATEDFRALVTAADGMSVQLTGFGPLTKDSAAQSEKDLQLAETVSLPFVFIILVAVFASLIAAGMPLLVAGLAIPSALALIGLVAGQREMSIYVLNVATMLGLALAIDYSLFIVSRFREELGRGQTVADAVERAVATAGKAVAFSGIAVAIGLSGLLLMKAPALSSIGIGGSLVVICSVVFALTFLPALLGILGHRINALSLGGLFRRFRGARPAPTPGGGRWERVALGVMRRPIAVIVPTLAFLFVAGSPFFRLEQGIPDANAFPPGLESRDAYVAIQQEFPRGETAPIIVLVDVDGDVRSADNIRALVAYADRLLAVDGIDKVESPFSGLLNPQTGAPLTADEIVALYSAPTLPPQLQALYDAYVAGSTVRLDAISPIDAALPEGTAMIPGIRALDPGPGLSVQVGGTAALGHDFLVSQGERIPWAVGLTLLASAVILFLLFGSIAIPIKAVIMTLLSISASFGALVWIFQEGNLSEFLAFEALGYTVAGNPIIMFAVLFGLSMDYEVLLLSRIQEAYRRTGDNRASVAEGLAKTAGVITGAALIMVTVFAAFALAETITIKSIGVGMAIAVLLDATIIRILLVPATMRLLGNWNWWAPGALGRIADRFGFSHDETRGDGQDPTPEPRPAAAAG